MARTPSASKAAAAIKETFESVLYTFKPDVQRHWCERMYRLSGDTSYLYPIILHAAVVMQTVARDVRYLDDSTYVLRRARQILEDFKPRSRKGRVRRAYFAEHLTGLFYLSLLNNFWRLDSYGLCDSLNRELCARAREKIAAFPYADYLLDTSLIRIYSPQLVNDVYYLYQLGLSDVRDRYRERFQQVFPDSADRHLSARLFEDKIYGLTHFITAGSRYYQQRVDTAEFGWILDYFAQRSERILKHTKADVIAEVGICFLLAGQTKHPLVNACREKILKQFDRKHGMVPSQRGSYNKERGEHRNILAYMLLTWKKSPRSGPNLARSAQFRRVMRFLRVRPTSSPVAD